LSWKIHEDKLVQQIQSNELPFVENIKQVKEIQKLTIEDIFDGILNYDKNEDLKNFDK
jgi:hypothetical protein